jgi:hypothetical protein
MELIELNTETRLRITEMQLARTKDDLNSRLHQLVELIDERNQLVADRERLRQANVELLRRLDAVSGYAPRLMLEMA